MKKIKLIILAITLALAIPSVSFAYTQVDIDANNGHGAIDAQYLVIHDTSNPGATAKNHVTYWENNPRAAQAHYVCDWTGFVYEVTPPTQKQWHVGNANGFTVGIEICDATNYNDFVNGWNTAADWAADFLTARGWDTSRMISHDYAARRWGGSDHNDPHPYFNAWGYDWNDFVSDVQSRMNGTHKQPEQTQPTDTNPTSSFAGTYTCQVSALNIRDNVWGNVVGTYYKCQTVNLDGYIQQDGLIWGYYEAYSGNTRYVCVGKATGNEDPSDYLIRANKSSGTHTFSVTVNIRDGVWGNIVGTYPAGNSVNYNYTVQSDGITWGVYQSWSGNTRYVALL